MGFSLGFIVAACLQQRSVCHCSGKPCVAASVPHWSLHTHAYSTLVAFTCLSGDDKHEYDGETAAHTALDDQVVVVDGIHINCLLQHNLQEKHDASSRQAKEEGVVL